MRHRARQRPRPPCPPADPTPHGVVHLLKTLGPGLVTGAADDDPSGIATYATIGAAFGYLPLWTALFSLPLMAAIQLMCARLGLVTGRGLAGVIRHHYPRWLLWGACGLLAVANLVNVAADLAGMGAVAATAIGGPAILWVGALTVTIVAALIWASYRALARVFKWLSLALLAYVVTAFAAHVDWPAAIRSTFVPRIEWSRGFFQAFTALMGTTISPYLFFWQAAQEVEEERADGRALKARRGATREELADCRTDVLTGMTASNVVMYFILLVTAATLHTQGRAITTPDDAANALRPLLGAGAFWLFSLAIIGTGMIAVPVLGGSTAYAIAEAMAWRGSLDLRPHQARRFYRCLVAVLGVGALLACLPLNAMHMLFVTAVLNGVLAPPLIVIVILATSNPAIMGSAVNTRTMNALGYLTLIVMVASAVALCV